MHIVGKIRARYSVIIYKLNFYPFPIDKSLSQHLTETKNPMNSLTLSIGLNFK